MSAETEHNERKPKDTGGIWEALSFARVRQDPWLAREIGEDEMGELVDSCASELYLRATNQLELQMKLSAVRLVPAEDEIEFTATDQSSATNNRLKFGASLQPPRLLKKWPQMRAAWTLLNSRPASCLFLLLIAYLTAKSFLLSYLYYARDSLLVGLRVELAPNSSRWRDCAVKSEASFQPPESRAKMENMNAIFNSIGTTLLAPPGVGVMVSSVFGGLLVSFFFTSALFLGRKRIQVDFLCFIEDPLNEVKRAKNELQVLANNLTLLISKPWTLDRQDKFTSAPSMEKTLTEERRHLEFRKIVANIIKWHSVRPVNLTGQWHRALLHLTRWSLTLGLLASISLTFCTQATLVIYELHERAQKRLALIECRRWHPNGTHISSFNVWLDPLELDEHLEAYESFGGGARDLAHLMFAVESRYYFSPARLWFIGETIAATLCYSTWASFYATIYLLGFINQLVWLVQIEEQIKRCLKLCAYMERKSIARLERGPMVQLQPPTESGTIANDRLIISHKLTVAHLNFELFRRNHARFQRFAGFMLDQVTIVAVLVFLVAYLVATDLKPKLKAPIIQASFAIVMLLNAYLATISYKSKKIERLLSRIKTMLVYCADSELWNTYPVELWRRQVSHETRAWGRLASSVFTISISYEQLVTCNVYLVALWLLLLGKH